MNLTLVQCLVFSHALSKSFCSSRWFLRVRFWLIPSHHLKVCARLFFFPYSQIIFFLVNCSNRGWGYGVNSRPVFSWIEFLCNNDNMDFNVFEIVFFFFSFFALSSFSSLSFQWLCFCFLSLFLPGWKSTLTRSFFSLFFQFSLSHETFIQQLIVLSFIWMVIQPAVSMRLILMV